MIQGKMPIWAVELLQRAASTPNTVKDLDSRIGEISAQTIAKATGELKKIAHELPYGLAQRYQALIPKLTPDEILDMNSNPFWCWYAVELKEFLEVFGAMPKQAFIGKSTKQNKGRG